MGRLAPGQALMAVRPFCTPHHSVSDAGLVGGGNPPQPGQISMSHKGVIDLNFEGEVNLAAWRDGYTDAIKGFYCGPR